MTTATSLLKAVAALGKLKLTGDSPSVRRRQLTEQTLSLALAQALLDDGFSLGVDDGEEETLRFSRDLKAVQKAVVDQAENGRL